MPCTHASVSYQPAYLESSAILAPPLSQQPVTAQTYTHLGYHAGNHVLRIFCQTHPCVPKGQNQIRCSFNNRRGLAIAGEVRSRGQRAPHSNQSTQLVGEDPSLHKTARIEGAGWLNNEPQKNAHDPAAPLQRSPSQGSEHETRHPHSNQGISRGCCCSGLCEATG